MITHEHAREIHYWTRDKWWCSDNVHGHLSLAAAEKCERKPTADTLWSRKQSQERAARVQEAGAARRGREA